MGKQVAVQIGREFPEGYRDALHSDTTIVFGWQDRLRILFGWDFRCHTATLCENPPGKNEHWPRYSHMHVIKPSWWPQRRQQWLYAQTTGERTKS
jgi:hypothetical protein